MAKKKKITINHYWSRSKLDPSKHLNESHHVYTHVSVKRMNNYFSSVFVGICTGQEYLDGISTPGDFGQLIEKEKKYVMAIRNKSKYNKC